MRDGSATYAEAIRRGTPTAIQIADRWHLWHNLVRAAEKVVAAHARCWAAAGPKRRKLTRETTTLARWHAIHDLLDHGVGLMDCARRLGLGLNTVKRYSRVSEPEKLRRLPQYRASLVDPYRDHLRARRATEPGVAVTTLLAEITDLGYTGSSNLLRKYLIRAGPSPTGSCPRPGGSLPGSPPAQRTGRAAPRSSHRVAGGLPGPDGARGAGEQVRPHRHRTSRP